MLALPSTEIGRGLLDSVRDSQACFREILKALSEPGIPCRLERDIETPRGLAPATTLALLTLVDFETPLWLATSISKTAANYLRFHTGAVIMDEPCEAQFAVIDGSRGQQDLGAFCPGDDRYPDRSATVIVQCRSMTGGPTARLSGPGIRGSRCVSPAGLWPDFWNEAAANAERYPLGIDILLVADREIMGLPRSTQIALASEST